MTRRAEQIAPADRDATALLNFDVEKAGPITGIRGIWVPLSFVRRAKRVATALTLSKAKAPAKRRKRA